MSIQFNMSFPCSTKCPGAPYGSQEREWNHKVENLITFVGSGVYFDVVESLVPGHEGKIQRGTFYIVR